jgi:hypothetical protein
MFRARQTVKRGQKQKNPVAGPITPVSANQYADLSGSPTTAIIVQELTPVKQEITTESMLSALLDAESKNAVHKPWLRLERGVRMRLLRAFVEKQKDLSVGERVELLAALVEALDKKLLNSKSQISYNHESGEITDIHSLKITKAGGKILFRVEPPNRNTKKVKRSLNASDSD